MEMELEICILATCKQNNRRQMEKAHIIKFRLMAIGVFCTTSGAGVAIFDNS